MAGVITAATGSEDAVVPWMLPVVHPDGRITTVPDAASQTTLVLDDGNGTPRASIASLGGGTRRVLIELNGTPLARVASRGRAASQVLAVQRGRAAADIARIAARQRGRVVDESEVIQHQYALVFHGFAARLSAAEQDEVRRLPDVRAVYPDTEVHAILDQSVPLIGAPQVWSGSSYRGAGTVIAVIDSGVDYTHADLGGCFGPPCKVIGGWDFANDDADPRDDHGHGTHVAATAAGGGTFDGVAPEASILAYKVLDASGSGYQSSVIAAIERAADPNGDLDPSDHAGVINLSLGIDGGTADHPMSVAVDNATAVGVLSAVSAGNTGSSYFTVGTPAAARTALTVGASDQSDQIASFSSRGPTSDTYGLKPEIVAPGVGICAARATGTGLGSSCFDADHTDLSGTSMAAPHVAGAAALLRGLFPLLAPAEIKALLVQNSVDLGLDAVTQGAGRIDVAAAAAAGTVVTPAAISFGRDDLTRSVWSTSSTLIVRNLDSVAQNYTLSTGPLPAGTVMTLTPSAFSLAPGDSVEVTVGLSVDNAALPNRIVPYEGMVLVDSGPESQRIPFIFVKSPALQLTLDTAPVSVIIHDRAGSVTQIFYPERTWLEFLVPDGTYDVMVQFFTASWVFREAVAVNGFASIGLDSSEIAYDVTFSGRDENGDLLPLRLGTYTITHVPSSTIVVSTAWLSGPGPLHMAPVSDFYRFDFGAEALRSNTEYLFVGTATGISGDLVVQNSASDLASTNVRYNPRPGAIETETRFFLGVQSRDGWFPIAGRSLVHLPIRLRTNAPTHQPMPVTLQYRVFDTAVQTEVYAGPLLQGDLLSGEIDALTSVDQLPILRVTGDLPLNLGPPFFFGRIALAPSPSLAPAIGNWSSPFLGQSGDEIPASSVPWRLASGLTPIQSGELCQFFGCLALTANLDATSPGPYTLSIGEMAYFVGGLPGTTRVTLDFDTSNIADQTPPYLSEFSLRAAGRKTDFVEPGTAVVVGMGVHDDVAVAAVTVTYDEGSGAVTVPTANVGVDQYEMVVPACTGPAVALTVDAVDVVGNRMRQQFAPAYVCRPAVCGDGIVGGTEQCDDGNGANDDGCKSNCTLNVCGDGVLRAGVEECDDGNLAVGDGCRPNCTRAPVENGAITAYQVSMGTDAGVDGGWVCSQILAMQRRSHINGDAIITGFRASRFGAMTSITGDVVTVGGPLSGRSGLSIGGRIDVSGTGPELADCIAGSNAMNQKASELWNASPTEPPMGDVRVGAGASYTLVVAGNGQVIIEAESIDVRRAGTLLLEGPLNGTAVIRVRRSLRLGPDAAIEMGTGLSREQVLFIADRVVTRRDSIFHGSAVVRGTSTHIGRDASFEGQLVTTGGRVRLGEGARLERHSFIGW